MCRRARVSLLYLEYFSCLIQCECKYALSLSFSLSFFRRTWALGPCLRTTWPDASLLSPVHLAVLLLQFQLFCLRLWNPDLCYLSQTCCFQLSRDSRSGRDTFNDWLWKANWHLLLRCWPIAPATTTVIIIIWPCWSSMNIWTSWPCSVIMSTRHSQKRTGHPT